MPETDEEGKEEGEGRIRTHNCASPSKPPANSLMNECMHACVSVMYEGLVV